MGNNKKARKPCKNLQLPYENLQRNKKTYNSVTENSNKVQKIYKKTTERAQTAYEKLYSIAKKHKNTTKYYQK